MWKDYLFPVRVVQEVEAKEIQEVEEVKELTIQEYVFEEVKEALGVKEAITVVSFIGGCENPKWNPDLVIKEPNGSLSYGIFMINSIHKDISNADKLDYKKATAWSIEKRKRDGSWLAWSCYKK